MRKLLPLLLCLLLTLSAAGCAQEDPKIPTPTQPSGPDIAQGFLPLDRHITYLHQGPNSHILIDGTLYPTALPTIGSAKSSLDGERTAIVTEEGDLHLLTPDQLAHLDSGVIQVYMSVSGQGLAYLRAEGDGYALKHYDGTQTHTVTTDPNIQNVVLSPDGKSLAYLTIEGDTYRLIRRRDTDEPLPKAPDTLLGMDDKGNVYGTVRNESGEYLLYHYDAQDQSLLGQVDAPVLSFNADHSQLLYHRLGDTHISTGGAPARWVCTGTASALLPPGTTSFVHGTATTWPVEDLYSPIYSTVKDRSHTLWKLSATSDPTKLVEGVTAPAMDAVGVYVYYIKEKTTLCRMAVSSGTHTALVKGVEVYRTTSRQDLVYFTSGSKLYVTDGTKSTCIFQDKIDPLSLTITKEDYACFLWGDGLYICPDGKTTTRLLPTCQRLSPTPNGILYVYDDTAIHTVTADGALQKLMDLT